VQLVVTSMQQIFGGGVQVVLRLLQHNEIYEIMLFVLKCLDVLFLMVTWLQCSIKALNVAHSNNNDRLTAFDPGQPG